MPKPAVLPGGGTSSRRRRRAGCFRLTWLAASTIASPTPLISSSPSPAAASNCSAPVCARLRIAAACARAHSSVCSTSARAELVSSVAWWRDCSSRRLPLASASRSSCVASRFEFARARAPHCGRRSASLRAGARSPGGSARSRIRGLAARAGDGVLLLRSWRAAPRMRCCASASTVSANSAAAGSDAARPCDGVTRWARRIARSGLRPGARGVAPAAGRSAAGKTRTPRATLSGS